MKAGSHPTISKSYNKTVNGQKVMMEQMEIKMVIGHNLVDEDGEFTMSRRVRVQRYPIECPRGEKKILSKQLIMLVM